jgi:hypothetical protein
MEEIENCQWIELTGDKEWNPHCESFAKKERIIQEAPDNFIRGRVIAAHTMATDTCASSLIPLEISTNICSSHIQIAVTESHAR